MNEFEIRKYNTKDINDLKFICLNVFGDRITFIDDFFSALSSAGFAVVGLYNNIPVSMACIIDSLSYKNSKCAYLYAVATLPDFRGNGFASKVVNYAIDTSYKNGINLILTSPAEENLFNWYSNIAQFEPAMCCNEIEISYLKDYISPFTRIKKIDANTYNLKREIYLQEVNHIKFDNSYVQLENILCTDYDGGLFMIDEQIICAFYVEKNNIYIREILGTKNFKDIFYVSNFLLKKYNLMKTNIRFPGILKKQIATIGNYDVNDKCWFGLTID